MSEPPFGSEMYHSAFPLRGKLQTMQWCNFLVACAHAFDMDPIAPPAIWEYPVGGKGGAGVTIVQPITESFLALDVWPAHAGAYMFIASCKPFESKALTPVYDRFGIARVREVWANRMQLRRVVEEVR